MSFEEAQAVPDESSDRLEREGGSPTLEDAIREGLSPREAKRLALRVSETVAERHARGLVHGELTPRSILLDRRGGVTVADAMDPGPVLYRLRYAAPEVARREDPGKAADVFSLSLIIRELIEGIPARRSEGETLAMEAVDGRVSIPHGLERELHALAAQAASQHIESRPSAAQFVAALKGATQFKGFSGQEWVIVALALGALVMLAMMLKSSARENELSNRQVEGSRAAVDNLLMGTYPELDRIPELGPLAEAGQEMLVSLEETRAARPSEEQDLLFAKALAWNGEVQQRLGNDDIATKHLEAFMELSQDLPDGSISREVELSSRLTLATLAKSRHEIEVVEGFLGEVLAIGLPLVNSGEAERSTELAVAEALLEQGDLEMASGTAGIESALVSFEKARTILALPTPDDTYRRQSMEIEALIVEKQAYILKRKGDETQSVALMEHLVKLRRALVAFDPGNAEVRKNSARASSLQGRTHRMTGHFPAAVESFRTSVEGWRFLFEMEPDADRRRLDWARATRNLAYCLDKVGEWQEAAALRELALAELIAIDQGQPVASFNTAEVGELQVEAAEGFLAAGDLHRARQALKDARAALKKGSDEEQDRLRLARVRSEIANAELHLGEGRWDNAENSALRVIDAYESYASKGRGGPLRDLRARALFVTSAVRAMKGEVDNATNARERALGIARELAQESIDASEALALEARALFLLGRDAESAAVLDRLEALGYRGLELNAARASALHSARGK